MKEKGEILRFTKKYEQLREALADYQEEKILAKWHEDVLLQILTSDTSLCFSLKDELTKKEKKLLIRMLKDFGGIDDPSDIPLGKAMELGYGSRIQILIKILTPRWKRWLSGSIGFCISCLVVGLITKWLLHSFSAGVFTVLVSKVFYEIIRYIPVTYFQNELIIRHLNSSKSKKTQRKKEVEQYEQ